MTSPASVTDSSASRWGRGGDLAAVGVALVLPSIITWIYFFGTESAAVGVQLLVFNVVKVGQFVLPIAWVVAVQRGPARLPVGNPRGLGWGLALGLLIVGAIAALYFGGLRSSSVLGEAVVEIQSKVAGFGIDSPGKYFLLGAFYSLCHSLLEEYYWRWFVFGQLRRHVSLRMAIGISALGFMAHHVLVLGKFFGFASVATWFFSASVAVGGAIWAWLYHRSGSLLGPWMSHLLVDAAIFGIGYDLVRSQLIR
jgi:membrane protease YdiL (CAAX protease family)